MQIDKNQIDSLIPEAKLWKSRRHALAMAALSIGPVLLLIYLGIHWFPEMASNNLARVVLLLAIWVFIDLVVAKTTNKTLIKTMKGLCYASFIILGVLVISKGLLP